jgi:RNA polymerase subunit RPABC4/transcription elongation factor Spt4
MPQLPDLSGLGRVLELFIAFLGAYLFAVWVSMIVWTVRDIRSRSRDIFAQMLAIVLVIVFNVAGLLLYFILRPRETLAEKYERELAEEAMLQDIEERQVCPVCEHKITAEYLICPNCHTKLHKKCEHCGRVLNLKWGVCPFCGEPQALPATPRLASEPPARPPLPPTRERKRDPLAPHEGESAPVPAAPPPGKEQTAILLGSLAMEAKPEPPPDGRSQATHSPLAPPDAISLTPPEKSP